MQLCSNRCMHDRTTTTILRDATQHMQRSESAAASLLASIARQVARVTVQRMQGGGCEEGTRVVFARRSHASCIASEHSRTGVSVSESARREHLRSRAAVCAAPPLPLLSPRIAFVCSATRRRRGLRIATEQRRTVHRPWSRAKQSRERAELRVACLAFLLRPSVQQSTRRQCDHNAARGTELSLWRCALFRSVHAAPDTDATAHAQQQ